MTDTDNRRHGDMARVMAEQGWTLDQFAMKAGVSQATASAWYRFKAVPKLRLAIRLRDDYGIPIESWGKP